MPGHARAKAGQALSDLEGRFVREHLVDVCPWKAYRRADGGVADEKNWSQLAYQMMQRPHVREAVQKSLDKQFARLDASGDRVVIELARLAFFDPAHLTGVECPEDIAKLPEELRRAIVGWSWDKQGRFTIKMAKEGALEMLGRRFGLFRDKVEHSGHVTVTASPVDQSL